MLRSAFSLKFVKEFWEDPTYVKKCTCMIRSAVNSLKLSLGKSINIMSGVYGLLTASNTGGAKR